MHLTEYYQKREERIRAEWFPKHVATWQTLSTADFSINTGHQVKTLTWRNPESTNYYCRYVIDGRVLCVYGDIGEAVYAWGDKLNWSWLANMDLHYFEEKCQASESGRSFVDWDARVALEQLKAFLRETDSSYGHKCYKMVEQQGGFDAVSMKPEWDMWLNSQYNGALSEFMQTEDFSTMRDCGEVFAYRCQGHLIGIKMAFEQLKAEEKV